MANDWAAKANTPPPPRFVTTNAPYEIWQARGYAHNLAVAYRAAAFKSQDVQDLEVVPLIGAAVATAAVAIAKTSTVAVAATGIGASAGAAAYAYAHPDADAATEQDAEAQLMCVVDESEPLHDLTSVNLILDRAAIEDALSALQISSQNLLSKSKLTDVETSQKQAVTDAVTSAGTELGVVDKEIQAYDQLAKLIYKAADDIDATAKSAGRRAFDFNAISQQITTAAKTQADKMTAQKEGATAKGSEKAAANAAGRRHGQAVKPNVLQEVTTGVKAPDKDLAQDPSRRTAVAQASQPVERQPAAQGPAASPADPTNSSAVAADANAQQVTDRTAAKYASLNTTLASGQDNDPGLLNRLVETAKDDDPDPGFSEIGSNISQCILKSAKAKKPSATN